MQVQKNVKGSSLLFFTLFIFINIIPTTMPVPQELSVGDSAPNFDIVNVVSNASSQLSDYLGKVIILDLFATWCGPCVEAIPEIIRIQNSYNASDLDIISIDVDASESYNEVVSFAERNNMSWIVSMDESNMNSNYGTGWIPTMYIIDQSGFVVYVEIGFDYTAVITTLDELIEAKTRNGVSYGFLTPLSILSILSYLLFVKTRKKTLT
ncbi:MAG: TlpA family protein disulfide reductase [Candidatus Hodarchaeales archaeon]|jgi:thiol-disulfide isomerase/thioredoxin